MEAPCLPFVPDVSEGAGTPAKVTKCVGDGGYADTPEFKNSISRDVSFRSRRAGGTELGKGPEKNVLTWLNFITPVRDPSGEIGFFRVG